MDVMKIVRKKKVKGPELGRALLQYLSDVYNPTESPEEDRPSPNEFNEAMSRLSTAADKSAYGAYLETSKILIDGAIYRGALMNTVHTGTLALKSTLEAITAEPALIAERYEFGVNTIIALLDLEAYDYIIRKLGEQEDIPELAGAWGYYRREQVEQELIQIDNEFLALIKSLEQDNRAEEAERLRYAYAPIMENIRHNKNSYIGDNPDAKLFNNIQEFAAQSVTSFLRRLPQEIDKIRGFEGGQADD